MLEYTSSILWWLGWLHIFVNAYIIHTYSWFLCPPPLRRGHYAFCFNLSVLMSVPCQKRLANTHRSVRVSLLICQHGHARRVNPVQKWQPDLQLESSPKLELEHEVYAISLITAGAYRAPVVTVCTADARSDSDSKVSCSTKHLSAMTTT